MTINDLCCDVCGRLLTDPRGGVRFVYHPGRPELRDSSGLVCQACWDDAVRTFGDPVTRHCASCGTPVSRLGSLHLRRYDNPQSWRLCASDAVGFLNRLRTVEPKLDPATFRFPFA
jgi:ribosomal protein S27E